MTGLLFNFRGRVGRLPYVVLWLSSIAFGFVLVRFPVKGAGLVPSLILLVFSLAYLWASLAIGTKRLHDLGKSGWWQLIGLAAIVPAILGGIIAQAIPVLGLAVSMIAIILSLWSLWIFIQMMFFPGERGSNDYGEPPAQGNTTPDGGTSRATPIAQGLIVDGGAAAMARAMDAGTGRPTVPQVARAQQRHLADGPRLGRATDGRRPAGFGRRQPG